MMRANRCVRIEIEEKRNVTNAGVISADGSRVAVRVMHTDEEVMIAKSVRRVLGLPMGKENEHGHEDEKA
jgi:acetate kinase